MVARQIAAQASALIPALALVAALARADDEPSLPPLPAPDAAPAPPPSEGRPPSSPASPEAAADRADDEAAPPPVKPRRFFWSAEAGYAVQSLYGVRMGGLDLALVLLDDRKDLSGGVIFDLVIGSTDQGLSTLQGTVGPILESKLGIARVGFGGRLGILDVQRITTDGSLTSASFGGFLRLTLDVTPLGQDRRSAIFVALKGTADNVGDWLLGVGLSVGGRF